MQSTVWGIQDRAGIRQSVGSCRFHPREQMWTEEGEKYPWVKDVNQRIKKAERDGSLLQMERSRQGSRKIKLRVQWQRHKQGTVGAKNVPRRGNRKCKSKSPATRMNTVTDTAMGNGVRKAGRTPLALDLCFKESLCLHCCDQHSRRQGESREAIAEIQGEDKGWDRATLGLMRNACTLDPCSCSLE